MHRSYLFFLFYVLCVSVFVFSNVICTTMVMDVLNSTQIDLGFNNTTDDSCNYWDYLSEPTPNYVANSMSGGLSVLQLNIRGVLGKQNLLKNLLNDVRYKNKVHIVMLVETWLKKTNTHCLQIPRYHFVGSHRKCKWGRVELES